MTVKASTPTSVTLPLGDVWTIGVLVLDADGAPAAAVPVITVTDPASVDTTPTVETVETGVYRAEVTVALGGRYVAAAIAAGYGVRTFTAFAAGLTEAADMPELLDVQDYLGDSAASWTDDQIQAALDSEAQAQRDRCKIPASYNHALRNALLRRCQVNLTKQGLPLALPQGDAGIGPSILPANDPEVRRLEGPWRKRKVG
jgi:hypothetical protein